MAAVIAQGLVKRFDGVEALRGVSLDVPEGETFGILGPNGAGKTTLMRILSTMLRPTRGQAWVGGDSVVDDPAGVRRQLGVVFQQQTLDGIMTARENLWIHGRLYGVARPVLGERIQELLDVAGLSDRAEERVQRLSGGMRRRLELVRAILHRPRVLLLDEPTVGLDPQSRRSIWEYVGRVRREMGITMLLTTHYMDEADALCDRIAIIDRGEVTTLDDPAALKRQLGGDRLTLRLDGSSGKAVRLVDQLDHVEEARLDGTTLHVRVREAPATVPAVLQALAGGGVRVVEMHQRSPTLDDVFLELTGRAPRGGAPRRHTEAPWWRRLVGRRP